MANHRAGTRSFLAALCALLACGAWFAPAASANKAPRITRFAIRGSAPTELGGVVALKLGVKGAPSCRLEGPASVVGVEWQGRCGAHHGIHQIWVQPNTRESAK